MARKRASKFTYKGAIGLAAIAQAQGVNPETLRYRVHRMGLSVEQALSYIRGGSDACGTNPRTKRCGVRKPNMHPLWALALGMSYAPKRESPRR
ncbi:MAG: hypothetical protein ACRCSE_01740 [Vibrio sp.]